LTTVLLFHFSPIFFHVSVFTYHWLPLSHRILAVQAPFRCHFAVYWAFQLPVLLSGIFPARLFRFTLREMLIHYVDSFTLNCRLHKQVANSVFVCRILFNFSFSFIWGGWGWGASVA
jgi:hypothetical protein